MAIIRYERSAATVSWIDPATELPEVDQNKPNGPTTTRQFLTGNAGFRFCNFIEAWISYDTAVRAITGYGFNEATSKIYRAPSFAKIPSHVFPRKPDVGVAGDAVTFTQIIGARTQSPEVIGGIVGGVVGGVAGGYVGEKVAHKVSGFPPIWSQLRLKIFNDGRFEVQLLQHSLFPSLTLYKVRLDGASQSNNYDRVSIVGASYYDAVPSLENWKKEGWGPVRGGLISGPTAGNPWGVDK
jgi:hypothetical protein